MKSNRWPPAYFANRGAAHVPRVRFLFEPERDERLDLLLNDRGCVLSLSQEPAITNSESLSIV